MAEKFSRRTENFSRSPKFSVSLRLFGFGNLGSAPPIFVLLAFSASEIFPSAVPEALFHSRKVHSRRRGKFAFFGMKIFIVDRRAENCYNLYMKQGTKKLIVYICDLILLLTGVITALCCNAAGISQSASFTSAIGVLFVIVLCFLAVFITVEIISVIKISDSTFHTVLLAVSLFLFVLFSDDFDALVPSSPQALRTVFDILQFIAFESTMLSVAYFWNYTFKLGFSKKAAAFIVAAAIICAAGYAGLYFVKLQFIAFAAFAMLLIYILCVTYARIGKNHNETLNFYITEALFYSCLGLSLVVEVCDATKFFSAVGYASLYGVGIVILFCMVYVTYAMRTDRAALEASEYKLKYQTIKAEALRSQIKPHFIFNSLAAIQSLYHKSLADGDKATILFSRHLRANIEAVDTDLIPFERELNNIQVYIDLENMRQERKFNVIFDIDATDFEIPALSLQPYIENAIRYSKANEKEGGYILISSRKTEGDVVLEISDNGVGFDPKNVPASSCGIRNSKERFKMLMGVEPTIVSEIGQGTTVRVIIPKTRGDVV